MSTFMRIQSRDNSQKVLLSTTEFKKYQGNIGKDDHLCQQITPFYTLYFNKYFYKETEISSK